MNGWIEFKAYNVYMLMDQIYHTHTQVWHTATITISPLLHIYVSGMGRYRSRRFVHQKPCFRNHSHIQDAHPNKQLKLFKSVLGQSFIELICTLFISPYLIRPFVYVCICRCRFTILSLWSLSVYNSTTNRSSGSLTMELPHICTNEY